MTNQKPQSASERALADLQNKSLSRRELLLRAGQSATALLVLAALEEQAQAKPSKPQPKAAARFAIPADIGKQQFPYYTDGPWDKEQYFETITAGRKVFPKMHLTADIDGDGRDELIARSAGGILASHYDHESGQWLPLPDGPKWDDGSYWDEPQYYSTIQCADINNDGRAELIARYKDGIVAWQYVPGPVVNGARTGKWSQLAADPTAKQPDLSDALGWDQPQYYSTIQCADIDNDGRAEVLARSANGIIVWKYGSNANPTLDSWERMPDGPDWSDQLGWNQQKYYQSIQCGNLDSSGRAILMGRASFGMIFFQFTGSVWRQRFVYPGHTGYPSWIDADGWDQPQYYQTIQCAKIKDAPVDRLIVRNYRALEVWEFTDIGYQDAPGPEMPDDEQWNRPEIYQTIQCADIDGDGVAEIIARYIDGVRVWKYNNGTPTALASLPIWSDANGWNKVQNYSTIQTARIFLPGDKGYIGDGTHVQSALLGRGPLGVQTFRYVTPSQEDEQTGWVQTSAGIPKWTPTQWRAYHAIGDQINDPLANDIRAHFNNEDFTDRFTTWQAALYGDKPVGRYNQFPTPPSLTVPPGGISQEDWDLVTWQMYWEMQWVKNIYKWYSADQAGGLITANTIDQGNILTEIYNILSVSQNDTTAIVLDALALVASIAAAVLSGGASLVAEGTALAVASAVMGAVSGTLSAIPGFLPSGNPFQGTYDNLKDAIGDTFEGASKGLETYKFALTGGMDTATGAYSPPDYGRLKLIGEWIQDGTWAWETGSDGGTATEYEDSARRGYALYAWQTLLTAHPWYRWDNLDNGLAPFPPSNYPDKYIYRYTKNGDKIIAWLMAGNALIAPALPLNMLNPLFESPVVSGSWKPLAIRLDDVIQGKHGWGASILLINGQPIPPATTATNIRPAVDLSRDTITGEIIAAVTFHNLGLKPGINVEITSAQLGANRVVSNHASRPLHLMSRHPQIIQLRFPAMPAGTATILRLSGRCVNGTFGGSYRVKLPQ